MTVPCPLFLNKISLETVDSFKYLGINMASDLTWTQHIQAIASKARRLVGLLFHFADTNTLRKLYVPIIWPHLEYASPIPVLT